jgi:hypothetical protein
MDHPVQTPTFTGNIKVYPSKLMHKPITSRPTDGDRGYAFAGDKEFTLVYSEKYQRWMHPSILDRMSRPMMQTCVA